MMSYFLWSPMRIKIIFLEQVWIPFWQNTCALLPSKSELSCNYRRLWNVTGIRPCSCWEENHEPNKLSIPNKPNYHERLIGETFLVRWYFGGNSVLSSKHRRWEWRIEQVPRHNPRWLQKQHCSSDTEAEASSCAGLEIFLIFIPEIDSFDPTSVDSELGAVRIRSPYQHLQDPVVIAQKG